MTGNLNLQGTNRSVIWKDMNGSTLRRQIWAGFANSNGGFFLYDATANKQIIGAGLNGTPMFSGVAERANNVFGAVAQNTTSQAGQSTVSLAISFGFTLPNTNYSVTVTPHHVAYGDQIRLMIGNKTTTGFTLVIYNAGAASLPANLLYDWVAVKY